MRNYDTKLAMLEVHRNNLANAKTFEDYRNAHVSYVDMLIEQLKADDLTNKAIETWLEKTDIKEKIKTTIKDTETNG